MMEVTKESNNETAIISSSNTKSSTKFSMKSKKSKVKSYKIWLLDQSQQPLDVIIASKDIGQRLFELACDKLGCTHERDYFGLRYTDKNSQKQWLDLARSVSKQMKSAISDGLKFRVKHYPKDPVGDLTQEFSQYLIYLQIRRDLLSGRLICEHENLFILGGFILQAEFGDAAKYPINKDVFRTEELLNSEPIAEKVVSVESGDSIDVSLFDGEIKPDINSKSHDSIANFKIVFNQTELIANEISVIHKKLIGLTEHEAEVSVLDRASRLPTYGVDLIRVSLMHKHRPIDKLSELDIDIDSAPCGDLPSSKCALDEKSDETKDSTKTPQFLDAPAYLGLRHTGLIVFVNFEPYEHYTWDVIDRLACDGKNFVVHTTLKDTEKRRFKGWRKSPVLIFSCETKYAALAIWKWTIDRKSFFTLKKANDAKKTRSTTNIFRRSHSYRFIGRSQMELKSISPSSDSVQQHSFTRVSSFRKPKSFYHDDESSVFSKNSTFPSQSPPKDLAELSRHPRPTALSPNLVAVIESGSEEIQNELISVDGNLAVASSGEASTPVDSFAAVDIENPSIEEAPATEPQFMLADEKHPSTADEKTTLDTEDLQEVLESSQVISSIDQALDEYAVTAPAHLEVLVNGEIGRVLPSSDVPLAEIKDEHIQYPADTHSIRSTSVSRLGAVITALIIVWLAVFIAILETEPPDVTEMSMWSWMAHSVRSLFLVEAFDYYVYRGIRDSIAAGVNSLLGV